MPTWTLPLSLDQLPLPVSLELLLIVGRGAALTGALCVFAWAFSRWHRAQARDTQRVFEQLDLIQGDLHVLAEAATTMATQLGSLADRMATEAQLVPTQFLPGHRGYEQGIRLAQRGAASEEIVASCGLVHHEAELLVRLHGRAAEGTAVPSATETTPPVSRARLSVVG